MPGPVTNVAVRLGMDGQAEFQRDARTNGDVLEASFDRTAVAADRASAAVDRTTRRLQNQAAAARLSLQANDNQARFNAILGVDGAAAGSARASAEAFEAFFRAEEEAAVKAVALKAAIDPLWAAEQKLAAATKNADDLLSRGSITMTQHAAAVDLARREYDQAAQAQTRMARSGGLAAHELTNLTYQLNDVVVSLASGQQPMMVLMQQGAQVAQILGSRPGGVGGAISALVGMIPRSLVLIGAAATGFVVLGKSALDAAESQRRLEVSAVGVGRMAGLTARQLSAVAEEGAKAGRVSEEAARGMATEWAATGKISGAVFAEMIALQKDFAIATGKDAKAAVELLGQTFADPAAGAAKLNEQLGFLNATQMEHIRQLQQEGDRTAAQKYLAEQLGASVGGLSAQYGGLADQLGVVATAASNAWTWLGKTQVFLQNPLGLQRPGEAEREAQQRARAALAPLNRASSEADSLARSLLPDGRQALEEQRAVLGRGVYANFASGDLQAGARTAEAYNAVTRALQTYLPPAEKAHRLAELDLKIAGEKAPARRAELAAERERVKLAGEVVSAADLEIKASDAANAAKAAASRTSGGRAASLAREAQSIEVNTRETLAMARAYLESDSAALRAEARRKALTEATRRGIDVEAQARRQLQLSLAEQAAQAARSVADLTGQVAAQRQVNDLVSQGVIAARDAGQALQVETAVRPVLTAQVLAEGAAREVLSRTVTALEGAYANLAREQARAQALAGASAANDNIAMLRIELGLVSATAEARNVALARKRAELELDRTGLKPADPEYARRVEAAIGEAEAQNALARGQYAARAVRDQQAQMQLLNMEIGLVGLGAQAHDEVTSRLRTIQQLREQGISALSLEGQAILDNEAKLRAVTRELEAQQSAWSTIQGLGEGVLDQSVQLFRSGEVGWKSWRDLGLQAIRDVIAEMFKLAAVNPLKNALFGQSNPTISGVGGLLGGLFGSKSSSLAADWASMISRFKLPGFANGTDDHPGGLSWVGEYGPELVEVPKGSRITPAPQSRRLAYQGLGGGESITISMPVTIHAQGAGPREVDMISARIDELERTFPGRVVEAYQDAKSRRFIS